MMQFDGVNLWGSTALVCNGPIAQSRAIQERLPGLDGFRIYNMGADNSMWTCSGRIIRNSADLLEADLWAGCNYQLSNGLYTFRSTLGGVYDNCLLSSFGPQTPIKRLKDGRYTMRVQGVVVWATVGSGGPSFAFQSQS